MIEARPPLDASLARVGSRRHLIDADFPALTVPGRVERHRQETALGEALRRRGQKRIALAGPAPMCHQDRRSRTGGPARAPHQSGNRLGIDLDFEAPRGHHRGHRISQRLIGIEEPRRHPAERVIATGLWRRRIVLPVRWRDLTAKAVLAFLVLGVVVAPARAEQGPRVPKVLHLQLWDAYGHLRRAGLTVTTPSFTLGGVGLCWPRIAAQSPGPGTHVGRGSTVVLRLKSGGCALGSPAVPEPFPPPVVVPDFVAEPVAATRRWAGHHDLYWLARLPALKVGTTRHVLDNFVVLKQRPRAGSMLSLGVAGPKQGSFRPTPLDITARTRR